MELLTNTNWGVSGPVSRHTAVGFVSMELVARMTAEYHQQSSVTEKCLAVLQVSETIASLSSIHCRQFHNECLRLSENTASNNTRVWKLIWISTWSVDAEQSDQCCQEPHLNVCSGWNYWAENLMTFGREEILKRDTLGEWKWKVYKRLKIEGRREMWWVCGQMWGGEGRRRGKMVHAKHSDRWIARYQGRWAILLVSVSKVISCT